MIDGLDDVIAEGATRYDATAATGQAVVRRRWARLEQTTKANLLSSGLYSQRGERLRGDVSEGGTLSDDVERLEYALGLLKACVDAKLPFLDKEQVIPGEALAEEVLSAAGDVLYHQHLRDPEFVRLALHAVVKQQLANAMFMHKPQALSPGWDALITLLKIGAVVVSPYAVAAGLSAVVRQDIGTAAAWLYAAAFGIGAAVEMHRGAPKLAGFELAYSRWLRFNEPNGFGVTGAGALERLRQMEAEGVRVPAVAFDAAAVLQEQSTRQPPSLEVSTPAVPA